MALLSLFSSMFSSGGQSSKTHQKILIYDDSCLGSSGRGTSLLGIRHTMSSLKKIFPSATIGRVTPSEIKSGEKLFKAKLLIIPGGRDRPYHKELQGKGNENIRKFIESGGSVLGICAGAYYLSQQIEFTPRNPLFRVAEDRELGFYPGTCKGPELGDYHPAKLVGVQAAKILLTGTSNELSVYYNGGGSFPEAQRFPKVTTLATYKETGNPAILHIKVGKGTCLLSGVHLEYAPEELFPCELAPGVQEELLEEKERRLSFFRDLLKKLGV